MPGNPVTPSEHYRERGIMTLRGTYRVDDIHIYGLTGQGSLIVSGGPNKESGLIVYVKRTDAVYAKEIGANQCTLDEIGNLTSVFVQS
jgi:hypothetical protein